MPVDYLEELAEFVTSARLEELDDSSIEAAKNVVLDTIGAILAGSRLPENTNLARLSLELGGTGPASLLGHSSKAQPLFAALVNATAGVSLEMDEGNRPGGGHPSIHVTPGAIAVAEELGSNGKTVLESIIVGYEVTSRIGAGTQVRAEIHSHGTWGTIGAAAATARLMGFTAPQTRQAMNLAMSMSPANTWTPCLEGATIRNLYPGRSSFQGILAAHLCRCGFTGINDGPADLYRSILGQGFDPQAVVDGLGQPGPLRIQQNYFKLHACCLYNHPALDALQALLRQEQFTAAEVAQIKVVAPPIAATMTNPAPENMLAAKFSIPYAVAVAITTGATDISAFYPERVGDPQIRELAWRVKVVADLEMNLRRYDYPAAKVIVSLKDGRTLEECVTAQYGDTRNPLSHEELVGKFISLASSALGERTQDVIGTVYRLDQIEDIRELTRLLGGG
jgi:2-methylcitrate dehydratase PrpD